MTFTPYPSINGTLAGSNIMYFFLYANSVTHNMFTLFFIIAFFIVVFAGSMFAQLRITGRIRPDVSLLASSFVTFGLEVILAQYNGLINPIYFFITIFVFIVSLLWVALGGNE